MKYIVELKPGLHFEVPEILVPPAEVLDSAQLSYFF